MKCTLLFIVLVFSETNSHVTRRTTDVTTSEIIKEKVSENSHVNEKVKINDGNFKLQKSSLTVEKEISPKIRDLILNEPDLEFQTDGTTLADDLLATEGRISPEIRDALKKNISIQKASENRYTKSVYLEDVVFALRNQAWEPEELPCLNATLYLLRSLQNFTLWAVWNWDSTSSQPLGLLFGNRFELGNFDECMEAPWTGTHPELRTQYCLADIVLERTDHPVKRRDDRSHQPYGSAVDFIMRHKTQVDRALNELKWGACVPAACSARAAERLMSTLLARSHLGVAGLRAHIAVREPCQRPDRHREYDGQFYSFLIFMAVLVATNLFCTYLNYKRPAEFKTLKDDVIRSFCLKENAKNLVVMKKEGTEVLYGIRFLTMVFIVMDHQIGIFNSGATSNGLQIDEMAISVAGMFVIHDDLFVDTFFVLSGFLIAVAFMRIKNEPFFNPFLMILKRYVRLVVAFAVMIFFYASVFPYLGSGPLWNQAVAVETEPCRKNWWLNLLMVGNYVDSENICIVISWYIPCDFHFFVVTTLVFWAHRRWPRLALGCAGVLAAASLLAPGVLTYVRGLPPIQLFTYDFVKNPRANEQFHITYIKSHMRLTSYVIGLVAGCVFASCKKSGNIKRISKKWAITGAYAGLATALAVMLFGTTYLWRRYHPLEGALYASLNRPLWAAGITAIIMCCCLGRVPFVEEFLSWYPWVPLSRLSYGLYLTHTAIISRNTYVVRSPQYNDNLTLLTMSLGVVVMGCVSAFLIWIFAEAPINNLLTALIKSRVNRVTPKEPDATLGKTTFSVLTPTPGHSGHLQSNLPSTIDISSKM